MVLSSNLSVLLGVVSAEMFRNMQNSEIIRRMTEEFDEVPQPATAAILIKTDLIPVLENLIGQSLNFQNIASFQHFTPWCSFSSAGQWWLPSYYSRAPVEEVQIQLLWIYLSSGAPVSVQYHLWWIHDGHGHLSSYGTVRLPSPSLQTHLNTGG